MTEDSDKLIASSSEREATGFALMRERIASFDCCAHRKLGRVPEFFSVTQLRVMVERRSMRWGRFTTVSERVVKLSVDGRK